jgi:hypothetical protein
MKPILSPLYALQYLTITTGLITSNTGTNILFLIKLQKKANP